MNTPSPAAPKLVAVLLITATVVTVSVALVQAWRLVLLFVAVSLGG